MNRSSVYAIVFVLVLLGWHFAPSVAVAAPPPGRIPSISTSSLPATSAPGQLFNLSDGGRDLVLFGKDGPRLATTHVNPKAWGAVGDGNGHTLTSGDVTAHSGVWLGTYAAGDQWDYVGLQEALYHAYGAPGSENGTTFAPTRNRAVFIPPGKYLLNKALSLKYCTGMWVEGAGRFTTQLIETSVNTPCLSMLGCSYGKLDGIYFSTTAANTQALVEWDGDGTTRNGSVQPQQYTVYDCEFHGQGLAGIGWRTSKSNFQGDTLSFVNCKFQSCTSAGYWNQAANALSICFDGGDFVNCTGDGIHLVAGSVMVYGTNFEDGTLTGAVLTQTGYDINILGGANDTSLITGVRSESMKFISCANTQRISVVGCYVTPSIGYVFWAANTAYNLNAPVRSFTVGKSDGRLWVCTTAGTSGATEPTWTGTTVTDGTVVWTAVDYIVISVGGGSILNGTYPWGRIQVGGSVGQYAASIRDVFVSRPDWEYGDHYSTGDTLTIDHVICKLGATPNDVGGSSIVPWHVGHTQSLGGPAAVLLSAQDMFNVGNRPILMSSGSGNVMYTDVGIWRADATDANAAYNSSWEGRVLASVSQRYGVLTTSGTDAAGLDCFLHGGAGTGAGQGGKVRVEVHPAGTTGTATNGPVDMLVVGPLGTQMGASGTPIKQHISGTSAWTPGAIGAGATVYVNVTVTGAAVGDVAKASYNQVLADGLMLTQQVSATSTVRVGIYNSTAGSITPSAGTVRASVWQY